MKKSSFCVLVLFFISAFSFAQEKINVIGKYYTAENLNLRAAPSFHAKKIVTVPKHTAVYVIAEGPSETIDGKTAKWKKVVCDQFTSGQKYKAGQTGWMFSEYLSDVDVFTDEEIEKILIECNSFDNRSSTTEIRGFGFSDYEGGKTIYAFRDSLEMPGCYEAVSSVYHVKDGKIFLDKPFCGVEGDSWKWADDYFTNEDGSQRYLVLLREHSTEGEYCLGHSCDDFYSELKTEPVEGALIYRNGILFSLEKGVLVLPCDCFFYKNPSFNSYRLSFPDFYGFYDFNNDERSVLVYNLDRAFKGWKVSYSKYIVNSEAHDGIKGRWYLVDVCRTESSDVWIFVPDERDPDAESVELTVQFFLDAQKKGSLKCRVLSKKDIEHISDTHHHMNPWIDSCLDTFPE